MDRAAAMEPVIAMEVARCDGKGKSLPFGSTNDNPDRAANLFDTFRFAFTPASRGVLPLTVLKTIRRLLA